MRILLILLSCFPLFATSLLNYNIYERNDRLDLVLSFDSQYDGNIKQQNDEKSTVLLLNDLTIEDEVDKSVNSKIAQNILITPLDDNNLKIEIASDSPVVITASKTVDRLGLRIRMTKTTQKNTLANIPTKKTTDIGSRYIIVVGVLFALFLFLLYLKSKVVNKNKSKKQISTKSFDFNSKKNDEIKILYEKQIDSVNKLVLISYENQKYLVLVGNSNVFLDRFGEEKIRNENDFEMFFEQNKQKLNNYLQDRKSLLSTYKNTLEQ